MRHSTHALRSVRVGLRGLALAALAGLVLQAPAAPLSAQAQWEVPRSEPGPCTGLPATFTVPVEAGKCGRSPAIIRRMVDLPQPDGPSMQTNSPRSARFSTWKLTS